LLMSANLPRLAKKFAATGLSDGATKPVVPPNHHPYYD
jgi:hypothetical protein